MDYISKILTMLGIDIEEEVKVEQIVIVVGIVEEALLNMIGEEDIPKQLQWIVTEVSIQRYQMIGSESVDSENVGSVSFTYKDITKLLSNYKEYIDNYVAAKNPKVDSKRMWMI